MRHWNLLDIDAPGGKASPVVLHTDEAARAVLIVLQAGQSLGEHEVKEAAWMLVIEGTAGFQIGGDAFEAGAGTLVRFDPAERRAVTTAAGARLLIYFVPWPGEGHYRAEEMSLGG